MKDVNGDVKKEVRQIWKKYFERFLNIENERKAVILTVDMEDIKIE